MIPSEIIKGIPRKILFFFFFSVWKQTTFRRSLTENMVFIVSMRKLRNPSKPRVGMHHPLENSSNIVTTVLELDDMSLIVCYCQKICSTCNFDTASGSGTKW